MKKIIDDFTKNEILELSREFKKRRIFLGLSQLKLAKHANISQSIVNKFENGIIDPTYSTVLKIEKALEETEKISNLKAKDILTKSIISIEYDEIISTAIEIMRENDFTQLLVSKNRNFIGIIDEKSILDLITQKVDIYNSSIEQIIETPPIIVHPNYKVSDLNFIFQNKKTKCVLVKENDKTLGIITKSDLFKQ